MTGRPSRALRRIAGHTFAGLLAFGGCIPTIMGIMPVEKLDLLLLGAGARLFKAECDESLERDPDDSVTLPFNVQTSGSLCCVCLVIPSRSWSRPGQLPSAVVCASQHKSGPGS